jgi:hypothetical protein
MNNAGLIEKQNSNANKTRTPGQRIEDIEQRRPIKMVDPELADVDNIDGLYTAFTGCMARTLGKSNALTDRFEKNFAEYSIDIIESAQNYEPDEEVESDE